MTSWIIIGVLFLYMMYSLYNAFSIYKQHTTALKAFKAEHPNAKLFDISKGWVVSSVAMCAICVLIAIFIENMHVEASKIVPYRALYMVIALIFISMIFTSCVVFPLFQPSPPCKSLRRKVTFRESAW